jgi:hypothetical protein
LHVSGSRSVSNLLAEAENLAPDAVLGDVDLDHLILRWSPATQELDALPDRGRRVRQRFGRAKATQPASTGTTQVRLCAGQISRYRSNRIVRPRAPFGGRARGRGAAAHPVGDVPGADAEPVAQVRIRRQRPAPALVGQGQGERQRGVVQAKVDGGTAPAYW